MSGNALSFAIVTPSFNTARYLDAAVRSVIEQDWPNLDYVVMDGGSTDGTLDLLRGYGDPVSWISEPDKGQTDAINRGMARTRGEILGWLNSDDTYLPGTFRAVAEFFAAHPDVALVYGDANFIDADGKVIARCAHVEPFSRERLFRYSDIIVQPAAFFRRSAFDAVGGLDPSLHWTMDWDLWIKFARRFNAVHLRRTLANYRWLAGTKTATGGWNRLDEIRSTLAHHGLDEPAYVRLERVNLHLQEALAALRQGRVGAAAGHCSCATGILLSSARAVASLGSPRTWKIIWTGQVLRARAAGANQSSNSKSQIPNKSQ